MTKQLILLCFSLCAITGMAQSNIEFRDYNVDEFDKIVTRGGGNVRIKYSEENTLRVSAKIACIALADISVSSKTLYIDVRHSEEEDCQFRINVGTPMINELVQNGGGNIVLDKGFGSKDSFQCKIGGGGNIDVSELAVNSFHASISGGGKIILNAQNELIGTISGGGLIEYSGEPKVTSDISGGGSIRRK